MLRSYNPSMLFMGVLSVIGLPDDLRSRLESLFGPISVITDSFPFDFTDYYVPEMGDGIERFFISFRDLVSPDSLASIKTETNSIEEEYSDNGNRRINLDPGLLSLENAILATTKNRSHRIAIGKNLYAEVTLIYHKHQWQALPWTYADYRSERVQTILSSFREAYKEKQRNLSASL